MPKLTNQKEKRTQLGGTGAAVLLVLLLVGVGFGCWYAQSFKDVFISRGLAQEGKIRFDRIAFSRTHGVEFKYAVSDLPDCEVTGFLVPWRDGYRSLSEEYLNRSARRAALPAL